MTYKEAITEAMQELARDEKVCFVGYGIKYGGGAAGTLRGLEHRCIETPVAENLMAGLALGLALRGRIPVVYYERFDFVLNALDAIVNHVDKLAQLSAGVFKAGVLFRVVVGNRDKPLFTGATHTQDFTPALKCLVKFPAVPLSDNPFVLRQQFSCAYRAALKGRSTLLVEYKDRL